MTDRAFPGMRIGWNACRSQSASELGKVVDVTGNKLSGSSKLCPNRKNTEAIMSLVQMPAYSAGAESELDSLSGLPERTRKLRVTGNTS